MSKQILIPKDSLTIKHRLFLKRLSKAAYDPTVLRKLLSQAKPEELKALVEVIVNLLERNYPTGKGYLKGLYPFRGLLRKLSRSKTSIIKKRHILLRQNQQKGGLAFLVPLLAPLLGTLLSSVL